MSGNKSNPTVVALGLFDSVHLGHRRVIAAAKELAKELNADFTVFTFGGNLRAVVSGKGDKFVYSVDERKAILEETGVKNLFVQKTDAEFLALSKTEYLDYINEKFDIKGYVCGADFKFGKGASGTVQDIIEYAKARKQAVRIVDTVDDGGKRVSTSLIKELLTAGDITGANALLVRPFSVTGKVVKGNGIGKTLGFPTVNISFDEEKQTVKDGVYAGHIFIDGKPFIAVINFGTRPTFGSEKRVLEAHIAGFNGDLYGKTVTLFFDGYIREIKKFATEKELSAQIFADLRVAKALKGVKI